MRPLLRDGAGDGELRAALVQALALKPERHAFRAQPYRIVRFMATTGG